jgi:NodT family efflux transporter outer membrane factor (OMF) lipoprotein
MVIASGAGSAARRSIGTAVFWGMTVATLFGIVLVPALYVLFQTLREKGHAFRARHSKLHLLLILVLPALLGGCMSAGPDYAAPELPAVGEGRVETAPDWWTTLNDPELTLLVEEALQNNRDLKAAAAAVRAARARLGIARAAFGPHLDATGGFSRQKGGEDVYGTGETDLYRAGFDAAWEIDLFGGTRRAAEAALAAWQAEEAGRDSVHLALAAETAQSCIVLRTGRQRLRTARQNLDVQQKTYEMLRSLFESGLADELSFQQARYNLENTRASIPPLETAVEESLNALAVLTGVLPGSLHERLHAEREIPEIPSEAVTGIPADLLRRRPDVRKAERELAEQTARIGIAQADLYPKFTLNGSLGVEALSASALGASGNEFYSIGPGIRWALFHSGSVRNTVRARKAISEQTLAAYEQTVLTAVQEARNALTGFRNEKQRAAALSASTDAARIAVELAESRYRSGLSDFASVLETQRALFTFEDRLAESRGAVALQYVRLCKALGGGWRSGAE